MEILLLFLKLLRLTVILFSPRITKLLTLPIALPPDIIKLTMPVDCTARGFVV